MRQSVIRFRCIPSYNVYPCKLKLLVLKIGTDAKLKSHPLDVNKKYMEKYFLSNATARDRKEKM